MEYSDENLIAAHVQGDATAFREIVRRYGDGVLGYLVRMTGNRDQAEDLFQDTFQRVHEKAGTFRGGSFKSWVYTIATRLTIDTARRKRLRMAVSLDQAGDGDEQGTPPLPASNAPDPADELLQEERRDQVRRAIASLPVRQRAALVMTYYQQLSYPEVAQTLGCSVGSVKTQMSRALATLAKRLPDSVSVAK